MQCLVTCLVPGDQTSTFQPVLKTFLQYAICPSKCLWVYFKIHMQYLNTDPGYTWIRTERRDVTCNFHLSILYLGCKLLWECHLLDSWSGHRKSTRKAFQVRQGAFFFLQRLGAKKSERTTLSGLPCVVCIFLQATYGCFLQTVVGFGIRLPQVTFQICPLFWGHIRHSKLQCSLLK